MKELISNEFKSIEKTQNEMKIDIKDLKTQMDKLNEMTEDCEKYIQNIKSDMLFLKAKDMASNIDIGCIKSNQEFQHQEIKMLLDQIINFLNKDNIEE